MPLSPCVQILCTVVCQNLYLLGFFYCKKLSLTYRRECIKIMNITLKDGSVKTYAEPLPAYKIIGDISAGLLKNSCAVEIDGKVQDLRYVVDRDCSLNALTFDDEEGHRAFSHTASHMLALAITRHFPNAHFAIGPAIDNGFYYDIDIEKPFTNDELAILEDEMRKIAKEDLPLKRFVESPDDARRRMNDEVLKLELIDEHSSAGEELSFYTVGEFTDLCAGPHLMSTGMVKAVKLLSATGAYWRGNEKNKMLCRVYGTAFPKKSQLDEHLERLEEAKRRDHNKLGRDLGFFTTSELIGQGLPIMLPNGARVLQILQRFVEDEEQRRGWQLTKTPLMAKSDLYKLSGHWDHYREGMFVMGDPDSEGELFALRPMTCPFQYQAYLNKPRSYRDLPLRYNETSTLFRNEASGEMHGLIRVRQFTISEGHLICTPDQLEDEFRKCLELAIYTLKTIGLYDDISYRFSQWDPQDREKYIGTPEQWSAAQSSMEKILNHLDIPYTVGVGEAAFYGPKLDIQIKNVHGKEDTLVTIQIDQLLSKTFGMEYTDSDGTKKNPYIIHRTSLGCYERTLALLIEKFAGAMPLWLAPEQVRLMPIADRHLEYTQRVNDILESHGFRTSIDSRSEKIGYKIREAQLMKIPYMLLIGDKDIEGDVVSLRSRSHGDAGTTTVEQLVKNLLVENSSRALTSFLAEQE